MNKHEGSSHTLTKLVRGRAATFDHSPVEISEPRFVFTDAEARDDLHALPRRASHRDRVERPNTAESHQRVELLPMTSGTSEVSKPRNTAMPLLDAAAALRYQNQAQLGIGMAIGSPSHSPWKSENLAPPRSDVGSALSSVASQSFSSSPYSPATTPDPSEDSNKQRGRWKMLGGFFGKKGNPSPQEPFYKVQVVPQQPLTAQPERHIFQPQHRRQHSRSLDLHSTSTFTSTVSPAPTEQQRRQMQPLAGPKAVARTPEYSPIPPPKDYPKVSPNLPKTTDAPKLQVDIPDIKMERYSVMFNNVLNPRQSTLLMRRQAQLERLKVIETPIIEEPLPNPDSPHVSIRRATTLPSPAKSPSYSLFPHHANRGPSPKPPAQRLAPSPVPGKLQRATTAPGSSSIRSNMPKNVLLTPSNYPNTPQILIEEEEDSSPTNDSPVTPKEPSWSETAPKLSPRPARTTSFGEQAADHVNPRDHNTESIVVHFAPVEDGHHEGPGWKPQVPPPKTGAIELAGTPVYKSQPTTIVSPVPKRPIVSPLPSLNKPLPTPSPEPEPVELSALLSPPAQETEQRKGPATRKQIVIKGSTTKAPVAENIVGLEYQIHQISRRPTPPKHDETPPVPEKNGRPVRNTSPPKQPAHSSSPPARPSREQSLGLGLVVPQSARPTVSPTSKAPQNTAPQTIAAPQQNLTDFHVRSPRKASLPAQPSQPLVYQRPRKTSLAAVEMAARQAGRLIEQQGVQNVGLDVAAKKSLHNASLHNVSQQGVPSATVSGTLSDEQSGRDAQMSQAVQHATAATQQGSPPGPQQSTHPNPLRAVPPGAAEISIARQISISRRQQMMVPIVPKSTRGPQQATLVVQGGAEGVLGAKKHMARKSHHALLETA